MEAKNTVFYGTFSPQISGLNGPAPIHANVKYSIGISRNGKVEYPLRNKYCKIFLVACSATHDHLKCDIEVRSMSHFR